MPTYDRYSDHSLANEYRYINKSGNNVFRDIQSNTFNFVVRLFVICANQIDYLSEKSYD